MAVPPVRGQPYTFCLGLASQANDGMFQDSPTIAPGDVVVVRDTTVLGNITTLPSALAGCTRLVQVTVSADEMDGDQVYVLFHDAAGDEWKDVLAIIDTAAQTLDTISINVDAILADTGTDIPAAIAALNDLSAAELLGTAVEGTYTLSEVLQLMAAVLFGKASGGGTTTVTFRNTGDTADRVTATVDSDGNRTAVTLNV